MSDDQKRAVVTVLSNFSRGPGVNPGGDLSDAGHHDTECEF